MIEIVTGHREWDNFWPIVKGFIESNRVEIDTNGTVVKGYHAPDCSWLWFRDCIHCMEITTFLDPEIKSSVDFMLKKQQPDGSYMDFLKQDGTMMRIPTEADLEYQAVVGVSRAWLATGDDAWMRSCLPALERGLNYVRTHPWRWDEKYQLPKRAYTIDTWDFDIRDGLKEMSWPGTIDEKTHFGIMHGDVSGLYYAYRIMGTLLGLFSGHRSEGLIYFNLANELAHRANSLLWNGKFYRHRLPLDDYRVPGVDEDEQLSLSNPFDINRGLATPEMAKTIIRTYMDRRKQTDAFAEWFSIDPPFPTGVFGDEKLKPGVYVNGGIMPLVGGQLAKAAFRHGFPEYGVDILKRYFKMIDETGEAYLWYFPDGRHATKEESTSPEAFATDPWGSSSMMSAVVEGLAGVHSNEPGFDHVSLEPHWDAAGVDEADVNLSYEASGREFRYSYAKKGDTTEIVIKSFPHRSLFVTLPIDVKSVKYESHGKKLDSVTESSGPCCKVADFDNVGGEIRLVYKV
jgi:hypothetical protein